MSRREELLLEGRANSINMKSGYITKLTCAAERDITCGIRVKTATVTWLTNLSSGHSLFSLQA